MSRARGTRNGRRSGPRFRAWRVVMRQREKFHELLRRRRGRDT